jgi:hypothetical protein
MFVNRKDRWRCEQGPRERRYVSDIHSRISADRQLEATASGESGLVPSTDDGTLGYLPLRRSAERNRTGVRAFLAAEQGPSVREASGNRRAGLARDQGPLAAGRDGVVRR